MMPALQKIHDVESTLLSPALFHFISCTHPVTQIFQYFPLSESLLVSRRQLLPHHFETGDLLLQTNAKLAELLAK